MNLKQIILAVAILAMPILAHAEGLNWSATARLWYSQNVSTNVPPLDEIGIAYQDHNGFRIEWEIEPHPSIAELVTLMPAVEADKVTAAQAEHEANAPSGTLAGWSKREKCLLLVCYKLAQQLWPNMTKKQFMDNVKAEWDAVK